MMTIKWGLSPLEQLAEELVTTTVPCPHLRGTRRVSTAPDDQRRVGGGRFVVTP